MLTSAMLRRLRLMLFVLTAALSGCRDHYVISDQVLRTATVATIPPRSIAVAVERDVEKDPHAPPAKTYLRYAALETGGLLPGDSTRRRVSIVSPKRGRIAGRVLFGFGGTMVLIGLLSIIVPVALEQQHKLSSLSAGIYAGLQGGLLLGVGLHLAIPGAVLLGQTVGPPREVPPSEPNMTYLPPQ